MLIFADDGVAPPIANARFFVNDSWVLFYTDAVRHFSLDQFAAVLFTVRFAAYSEILPQSSAIAVALVQTAVNSAAIERDWVVCVKNKRSMLSNQPGMELAYRVSVCSVCFGGFAVGYFQRCITPLGAMLSDFAADGAFTAVKLFGNFGDGVMV